MLANGFSHVIVKPLSSLAKVGRLNPTQTLETEQMTAASQVAKAPNH